MVTHNIEYFVETGSLHKQISEGHIGCGANRRGQVGGCGDVGGEGALFYTHAEDLGVILLQFHVYQIAC